MTKNILILEVRPDIAKSVVLKFAQKVLFITKRIFKKLHL